MHSRSPLQNPCTEERSPNPRRVCWLDPTSAVRPMRRRAGVLHMCLFRALMPVPACEHGPVDSDDAIGEEAFVELARGLPPPPPGPRVAQQGPLERSSNRLRGVVGAHL